MKKFLSMFISLLLVLAMASVALATPFTLEEVGVTLELPEGMSGEDQSDEEAYMVAITVNGNDALRYAYILKYIEEFAGKELEELSDEEGQQLLDGIATAVENPSYGAAQTEYYSVLVVANGDGTLLYYVIMSDGWLGAIVAGKSDGVELTDAEIEVAARLLDSIEYAE